MRPTSSDLHSPAHLVLPALSCRLQRCWGERGMGATRIRRPAVPSVQNGTNMPHFESAGDCLRQQPSYFRVQQLFVICEQNSLCCTNPLHVQDLPASFVRSVHGPQARSRTGFKDMLRKTPRLRCASSTSRNLSPLSSTPKPKTMCRK